MKKIPVKKAVICLLIIVIIYVPALYRLYGKFPLVPKSFVNDAAGRVVDEYQNVFVLSAEQASSLAAVLSEYTVTAIRYQPKGTHSGAAIGMYCEFSIKIGPQDPKEMQSKAIFVFLGARDGKHYAAGQWTKSQYSLINDGDALYEEVKKLFFQWGIAD